MDVHTGNGLDQFSPAKASWTANHTPATPKPLGWKATAVIVAYGLALLLPWLGSSRVLTYHEMLFAQPAREMLASGNWIMPTVAGVPSTHKPPLAHWSIAASMWLFGSETEGIARLPSVFSLLATALIVAAFACRLHGRSAGVLAGLVQLTCFYSLMQARLAEADMLLAATVAAGFFAWMQGTLSGAGSRSAWWWMLVFYAASGAAFMTKGPLALVFIGGGVTVSIVWDQQPRRLRALFHPVGLAVVIVFVFAWPLAAYGQYPGILADWQMHNIGRFKGDMGGQKSLLFYFWMIPLLAMPWTPAAIAGAVKARRDGWFTSSDVRLLASWLLAGLCVLTAAAWKHKHYAIPILPPLSVAAGIGLAAFLDRRSAATKAASFDLSRQMSARRAALAMMALATTVVAYAATTLLITAEQARAAGPVFVLAGIGVAAIIIWESKLPARALCGLAFGFMWLVVVAVQASVMPHFDSYRDQAELAARTQALVPQATTLFLVEMPENQIVCYLPTSVERIDDMAVFRDRMAAASTSDVYLMGPAMLEAELAGIGRVAVLDRCRKLRHKMDASSQLTLFHLQSLVTASR